MRDPVIIVPAIGASVAFAAALDAYFRVGAVDWVIDLCFADPEMGPSETAGPMPEIPMKHTGHALLYASIGCALASTACVTSWWKGQAAPAGLAGPTREGRFALVAALSMVAHASRGIGPQDIIALYQTASNDTLADTGAEIAFDYFTLDALGEDPELFGALDRAEDRELVLCGAIQAARKWPKPARMVEVIAAIADAMGMTAEEIETCWAAHSGKQGATVEATPARPTADGLGQWASATARSTLQPLRHVVSPFPSPLRGQST